MTNSPTDLDILMRHIGEINAKDAPLAPADLSALISLYRRARAYRADPALKAKTRAAKRSTEGEQNLAALLGIGTKKPSAGPTQPALPSPSSTPSSPSSNFIRRI